MRQLLDFLFGCRHHKLTWPQKLKEDEDPHVTCLACGRRFLYDFAKMKIGKAAS